jgi:hypothetical protein
MSFKTFKAKVLLTFFAMLISAFLAGNLNAQSGTTKITGTVKDQQGASVPGATVQLTNPEKGFTRTTTTSDDGVYSFPTIPPGTYQIEVTSSNFKKALVREIKALVDNPIEVDVPLETGEVSAVVDVNATSIESVVNTQDASIGNNFVPQQITQLPTDLRRVTDLLTLQPGVTREGYVNGGRSDQSNITLDGVDINDQQTGGRGEQLSTSQGSVLRITTESVEEFRITTTNANASQGRSSGAQISLVTKSGTNNFHGVGFGFYRPTAFSANNFFNNLAGVERPSLARKIFGGALGGPIKKDRAFFFYSYEGQRERQGISVVRTVPLASLGNGILRFSGSAPGDPAGTNRLLSLTTAQLNAIFPGVGINPAAVAVFADAARRYPANDFTSGQGDGINTGGFRFNSETSVKENTHIARFDFNINDKQSLFVRGSYQSDNTVGTSYFPDTPGTTLWDHPYGFVVGHNWNISGDKVNNFRYGLTRQAFTSGGDSNDNLISFRFVYQPSFFARSLSRVTPVHNITDDFTLIKGNHTIQFGGNIRVIRNKRSDLGSAFDSAVANPSFYGSSGRVLDRPITSAGYTIGGGQRAIVQNGLSALIGRFSQYSGQYNYDIDGNILAPGTPVQRNFATEEYDSYVQDIWKPYRNLTLTLGLRYGLSRPVYETTGYQVAPNRELGEYFEQRAASSAAGVPYNELIQFELAGPKNDANGFYSLDKNNFQPRLAFAWSPEFKGGFLKTLFGEAGTSTIRGGFAVTNDFFGQQLAVTFNGLSTLGFTTENTISANTFNTSTNPAPRFTGFGQTIRSLPGVPPIDRFMTPADEAQRIESSLDATLVSPTHYSWNVSYGRQLPKGMYVEASYVGRKARNLLATRDIMALNNLVDKKSGVDWYTAAGLLNDLRDSNTPLSGVGTIPYFQNIFPNLGPRLAALFDDPDFTGLTPTQAAYNLVARNGYDILDWTYVQLLLDDESFDASGNPVLGRNLFFHPQYAAFSAFSTVARSDYHGLSFSLRQRLGEVLTYDFNYTLSKSMDDASGLQTADTYGSAFILNPLRQQDNYAVSDFDVRHVINANFIFQVPFGRGRKFGSSLNSVADAFLGGWQMTGIYRWNSGLPISAPFDAAQWATNWNAQSNGFRTGPVPTTINRDTRNIFTDPNAAYQSFRNARAGETGERNVFRGAGFSAMDLGLSKSFKMPYGENHKLQFRWEVFNVTNTQYFDADNFTRSTFGLGQDPQLNDASPDFGKVFNSIQGNPRRMQFGLRYSF